MKKFQKVLLVALIFVLAFTTFAFATEGESKIQPRTAEPVTTSANPEDGIMPISEEEPTTTGTEGMPEIIYKDVYRFDEKIEFSDLVDGNAFLFGNTVHVSGEVNGSVYIFANEVVIEENSYIYHSLYVFANKVTMNGVCYDLYGACNEFQMGENSYVYRDLNLACASAEITGYVNRNANIATDSLVLAHPNGATILGDLNYTAPREFVIDENAVAGTTTFRLEEADTEDVKTMGDILHDAVLEVIFIFVLFLLAVLLAPKFVKRSGEYAFSLKVVHALWIGLVATIVLFFLDIALLFLLPKLAVVAILLTIAGIILTAPVFGIAFTSAIAKKANMNNLGLKVLLNLGVAVAMIILSSIPGIGFIFGCAYYILGLGFMMLYLFDKERRKGNIVLDVKKEEVAKTEETK